MATTRERLRRIGQAIGRVQAFLIFSLVYWLIFFPLAILTGWRRDALEQKRRRASWHPCGKLRAESGAWRRQS